MKLGIDLGTSTTVAALTDGSSLRLLTDASGASVMPSVIAFPPAGKHLVGSEAKYRRPIDAENTLFSLKRIIGLPSSAEAVKQFTRRYPFRIEDRGGIPYINTRAGDFTAAEVMGRLATHIRDTLAAERLTPDEVVVGVPSQFSARQREAIVQCLNAAGFPNSACAEEPQAIARSYLRQGLGGSRLIAIYDLGGGTFNFAVCEVRGGSWHELASGGDDYLGGDDIDQLCADWVNKQALQEFRWDVRTNAQAMTRLIAQCEQAKIQLSTMQVARIKLGAVEQSDVLRGREVAIERKLLEQLISDLVRRTFVVCDAVLTKVGVKAQDIADVYLAGGSSRIPAVQANVMHYFGKQPHIDPAPETLVAVGAAILAQERHAAAAARAGVARAPSPGATPSKQRASPRVPVALRIDANIPNQGALTKLLATDISKGGVFIELDDPPPLDTVLTIRLDTGTELLEIRARVVHRATADQVKGTARYPGVGVEFIELQDDVKAALQRFVEGAGRLFGV